MKHMCGKMENKQNVRIAAGATKPWMVSIDDNGFERCVDTINYCPYCGDILDNEYFEQHEMVYKPSRDMDNCEILAAGSYFGVPYFVCSLGNHPVCYIEVSGIKELNCEGYDSEAVRNYCAHEPHGGFTWSDYSAPALNDGSKWFLGWDYAHCDDYSVFEKCRRGGRKWTTAEMVEEAKKVIGGIIIEED